MQDHTKKDENNGDHSENGTGCSCLFRPQDADEEKKKQKGEMHFNRYFKKLSDLK